MKAIWRAALVTALVVAGCGHGTTPAAGPDLAGRSNEQLARFLPVLADYPGAVWQIRQRIGPDDHPVGPYIDPSAVIDPASCADIPFQRSGLIAASTEGSVPNAIAGNSGEASVRIMRDPVGSDLITESLDWAKRCYEYRQNYPSAGPNDPALSNPTAVSVLPPIQIDGIEVVRIHLTDNREHRFQPEGNRESVVSLARVRGLLVVGRRHDNSRDAADILAHTIKRLVADVPVSKPLSDNADAGLALTNRSDKELQQLLPAAIDLPADWQVGQSTPVIRDGTDGSGTSTTIPADCDRVPFENNTAWRPDLGRNFREIATVTATRNPGRDSINNTIMLGIEAPGKSVIDETTAWVNRCATYKSSGPSPAAGTISFLPARKVDGVDVTTVHITGNRTDYTASLLRVRGLLLIATPGLDYQSSPLAQKTVDNLLHAQFRTAPTGPGPIFHEPDPNERPPGDVKLPAPTTSADKTLQRISKGTLVDPEQYHFGGYMPGDAKIRSPDYLHFHSPTGSIACTWRRSSLLCQVPHGTYPRTPKPDGLQAIWSDDIINFGWNGIQNGIASTDPVIYAESNVLPYGSTIRFDDTPGSIECLMQRDGLTCTDFTKGIHLSRDDLTPLTATTALASDMRSLPK